MRYATGVFAPRAILIGMASLMAIVELPHTFPPEIPPLPGGHLYVIGDSISRGHRVRLSPLARCLRGTARPSGDKPGRGGGDRRGRDVEDGTGEGVAAVVLVELGGNDLLSGLPTREFARDLETLLASLQQPGRTIVMLELPLFPFQSGYGRAQRALARRSMSDLITKWYLAERPGHPGPTTDGLHLSEAGTQVMADTVYSILGPALGRPTRSRR